MGLHSSLRFHFGFPSGNRTPWGSRTRRQSREGWFCACGLWGSAGGGGLGGGWPGCGLDLLPGTQHSLCISLLPAPLPSCRQKCSNFHQLDAHPLWDHSFPGFFKTAVCGFQSPVLWWLISLRFKKTCLACKETLPGVYSRNRAPLSFLGWE